MPKPVATSQQTLQPAARPDEAIPISPFALPKPGIGNSQGDQGSCCPATQDSSWDGPKCPLWQGTLTARGDQQVHGTSTYNQVIHRCLPTGSRYWYETAFCQNEAQTAKAIKEVRACCVTAIWDAEATCTAAIREVETACAEHTCILQQSHGECMQEMEREAIEEGRDPQSFLTACRVELHVCPPEACGVLMYPLQLLMGNMSLATLLAISSQSSTAMGEPTPETPHPTMPVASTSKWQHCSSGEEATGPATPTKEPTHQK